MNAAHPAERDLDEMRQEIDGTRSDMADKLGALEHRVMGTVQSAQEMVEESIQTARDSVATVKRNFDVRYQVGQHPWIMLGASCLFGLVLSRLCPGGRRRDRQDGKSPDQQGLNR